MCCVQLVPACNLLLPMLTTFNLDSLLWAESSSKHLLKMADDISVLRSMGSERSEGTV